MLERFVIGALTSLIVLGTPFLYKLGKRKKAEAIQKGKIYYGLLGCRVLGLFVLGIISSEMVLMAILGDSIEGNIALVLMLFVSFVFTAVYIYVYIKYFKKKLIMYQDNIVLENKKETKNTNEKGITHICLSNADEQPKTYGDFNVYGKDLKIHNSLSKETINPETHKKYLVHTPNESTINNEIAQPLLQHTKKEYNAFNIAKELSEKCAKTVIQINRKCNEIGIDYNERQLAISTFAYFFAQWAYTSKSITFAQVEKVQELYKEQFSEFNKVAFQDDSFKDVMENEQMFDATLERFLQYAKIYFNNETNSFSNEMIEKYILEFILSKADLDRLKDNI